MGKRGTLKQGPSGWYSVAGKKLIYRHTGNTMAREELETLLNHLGNVLPFLEEKEEIFQTLKDIIRSISSLRWMQEDKAGSGEKDYATVETLVGLLEEKIAQKQNRRDDKNSDNSKEN